jgi:hypothetical protein
LADSYTNRPRHEIARVSELLQAQLLQPVNTHPVQPRALEADFNIASYGGPIGIGFNEFTPLFEHDGHQLNVSGFGGSQNSWGDEVVFSGIQGRFSYSLGQFHSETDGFRANNDDSTDAYNAFLQVALSPDLNLQAEIRQRDSERGDLSANFDPDNFRDSVRFGLERDSYRIGLHYSPSAHSDVLLSGIYNDGKEDETDHTALSETDTLVTNSPFEDQGHQLEAQYLFRAEHYNVTAGLGYSDSEALLTVDSQLNGEPQFDFSLPFDSTEKNAYVYSHITGPWAITWTLGLSYTDFDDADFSAEELNPKLGVQWQINRTLKLRLAAFQTLKRALITHQTLEPTHIAGFNQFFDDLNGATARRYGLGLDWQVSDDLYAGFEVSRRTVSSPSFSLSGKVALFEEQEDLWQAYLYWAPHPRWALSLEYFQDEFTSLDEVLFGRPKALTTTAVPLRLHYFHPNGFFAALGVNYVDQDLIDSDSTPKADEFVLLNSEIGYRLPKQQGILRLGIRNALDTEFHYQDDFRSVETVTPRYAPERAIFAQATVNF